MTRFECVALALLAAGLAAPARAANQLDAATVEALGGTYAADCRKPGVRVLVASDTLSVALGKKEVVSHDVQRATTYAGGSTPADYRGTLLGDIRGGEPLVFHVYKDAKGLSLVVDADTKLLATFGKAALAPRFRNCEPAPKAAKPAAPPTHPKPAAPAAR